LDQLSPLSEIQGFVMFAATFGAVDRAIVEQVRMDGGCRVDLWSALANVQWHSRDRETVSFSCIEAGTVVVWVRDEGDYVAWYYSCPPGVVADWIGEAMIAEGWSRAPLTESPTRAQLN
jgi:hypothetical protein